MQSPADHVVGMGRLGGLLRHHRQKRGLLQEDLAALVKPALSINTIGNLERGRARPHRHTLEGLAVALELNAQEKAELVAAWRASRTGTAALQFAPPGPPADRAPIATVEHAWEGSFGQLRL